MEAHNPLAGDGRATRAMTRRRFIKAGAATAVVGSVGGVVSGVAFPKAGDGVVFPEAKCGDEGGLRVLVAYASQFGTTGEVAEAIGRTMCAAGATVDVKRTNEVEDIGPYDAVVVGGAIQYDNWMTEARSFVTSNEAALSSRPVAYFLTCGALAERSERAEKKALGYARKLEALSDRVDPMAIGRFAGVLDYGLMNWRTRIALRIVFTVMGASEGDYRDWEAIRSWAGEFLATVGSPHRPVRAAH